MGYLLVGGIVAIVMSVGMFFARRTDSAAKAFLATCVAIAVSVLVWMALSEPLSLSGSTAAVSVLGLEILVLAVVSVRTARAG